jgi:hypothetical protein
MGAGLDMCNVPYKNSDSVLLYVIVQPFSSSDNRVYQLSLKRKIDLVYVEVLSWFCPAEKYISSV